MRPPPNMGTMSATTWFHGSVPDVTPFPTGPYGGNPGSTDWQTAFPVIARNILLHYGDLAKPLLTEIWPSLELFMDYLQRLINHSTHPQSKQLGLLLDGARGDWIPPRGQTYPTPTEPISAFWHTLSVGYMAEIATAIGRTADAARYTARFEANRKAYHKCGLSFIRVVLRVILPSPSRANADIPADLSRYFYNGLGTNSSDAPTQASPGKNGKKRCCYDTGSQTNNIFALHIGAVPEHLISDTVGMLVASLRDRNADHPGATPKTGQTSGDDQQIENSSDVLPPHWIRDSSTPPPPFGTGAHVDLGIFGTTYLWDVLRKHDADSVGVDLLTETSYPSFGRMIDQGATTLWEVRTLLLGFFRGGFQPPPSARSSYNVAGCHWCSRGKETNTRSGQLVQVAIILW